MDGTAVIPSAYHLFTVNDNPEPLDEVTVDSFHHFMPKLMYLSKRVRPDIQTATAFLTTRVKGPDVDDKKKLRQVLQYLCDTVHLDLTLEADNMQIIKWWVGGSFTVHPDTSEGAFLWVME
jgi:hypothetical protein